MTEKDKIIDGVKYRSVKIRAGLYCDGNIESLYVFPHDIYKFLVKNNIDVFEDYDDSPYPMKINNFLSDGEKDFTYIGIYIDCHYYLVCDDSTFAKFKLSI